MTMTLPSPAQPLAGPEWIEIVESIEDLWPGTRTWAKADTLFDMFRPYEATILRAAVFALFGEGRQTAPSPSMLMGKVREIAGARGIRIPTDPCEHPNRSHIRPSDLGSPHPLDGSRGPGRLECANPNCGIPLGSCHCPECARDRNYAPQESR